MSKRKMIASKKELKEMYESGMIMEEIGKEFNCTKPTQVPLIVSIEHKSDFSNEEKKEIKKLFGDKYNIRQEQRDIKNHAHCHLESK